MSLSLLCKLKYMGIHILYTQSYMYSLTFSFNLSINLLFKIKTLKYGLKIIQIHFYYLVDFI